MRLLKKTSICLFLFVLAASVYAVTMYADMPESASIRGKLTESWFTENTAVLAGKKAEVISNEAGEVFQVRYDDETCSVIVAPQKIVPVILYTDEGSVDALQEVYPYGTAGSWVLFLDRATSSPLCIRYFFAGDSEVYVQFRPGKKGYAAKSVVDFVVFGEYAAQNISTGVTMEQLFTMSLEDIVMLTEQTLPWIEGKYFPEFNENSRQMSAVIQEHLDEFVFADKAVYDEYGELVMLKDAPVPEVEEDKRAISSIGFLKWIVDGLVRPVSGNGLRIEPLLQPTTSFVTDRNAMNEEYDTTLALDWTHNLATAAVSVITGINYTYETSGVDVHPAQFFAKYTENAGYPIDDLKPILYMISANETGFFYLGAVRHEVKEKNVFVTYNECAAFFPYFMPDGKFTVDVFADGCMYTLEEYMELHSGDLIQLTRISSSLQFFPD